MEREEKELNLFIGKTNDWEYVFVEKCFKDWGGWCWLTWNWFEFLTEMQKDERDDDYLYDGDWEYLFCEYIKYSHDHNTSFEDWVEMCKDEHPNWVSLDDSYCGEEWLQDIMEYASEKEWYDYEYSNCIHWGRMFDEQYVNRDNYEYVDEDNFNKLVELYKEYEWK